MKTTLINKTIDDGNLHSLLGAGHGDPFAVLGMQQAGDHLVVRVLRPDARAVVVRDTHDSQRSFTAERVHDDGFFEAVLPEGTERFEYELEFTAHNGDSWTARDPYSFGLVLGEIDLHLFAEGNVLIHK